MEKKLESHKEQPLGEVLKELRSNRQLMETLEPLNLTDKALVGARKDQVIVLPEKAIGQATELGRMSLRMNRWGVPELISTGMGREFGNVKVVDDLILPSKVLALQPSYPGGFHSRNQ